MQASVMCFGVSKSGSPIERLMTSIPSRCIFFALFVISIVAEGAIAATFAESCFIAIF